MAKFSGPAPQQKIEGADQVLGSMLITVDSGNVCICTPAINGTRAVVYLVWKKPATNSEINEVWEFLATQGMPMPEQTQVVGDAQAASRWARDYLKKGKQ